MCFSQECVCVRLWRRSYRQMIGRPICNRTEHKHGKHSPTSQGTRPWESMETLDYNTLAPSSPLTACYQRRCGWVGLSVQAPRPPMTLSLICTRQWFVCMATYRTGSPSRRANSRLFVQEATKPFRSHSLDSGNNWTYLWYEVKDCFFECVQVSLEE